MNAVSCAARLSENAESPFTEEGGDIDAEEVEEWVPELPEDVTGRPSLDEYQRKWDSLKRWH